MLMHRICNLYLIIYKRKREQNAVFFLDEVFALLKSIATRGYKKSIAFGVQ